MRGIPESTVWCRGLRGGAGGGVAAGARVGVAGPVLRDAAARTAKARRARGEARRAFESKRAHVYPMRPLCALKRLKVNRFALITA